MDYEHYTTVITGINRQLQALADQMKAQALTHCADPSNPAFVRAMDAQKRLTDLSAELSSSMLPRNP
jgi:hypothetical protein